MGERIDYTTLSWLKDEIQENLDQTRQALETYVENPDNATQVRFCATYLHTIYGTLQMLEIYGGALLAEEMEKLASALLNDEVAQKDDAYDVLMRGILQLPVYLEGLESGQVDMPVVLLPLLNDLRAARGENLLSENAFFSPDLGVAPPPPQLPPGKTYPDIQTYARKLRPVYQVSLLGWYRDRDAIGSLKKIAAVLRELQNASQTIAAQRLWWIAGGVVEALIDGGLETGTSVKLLMGHVDLEIKRLVSDGEAVFEQAPPTELLKNCLYYVGTAKSDGPRVSSLKQAFNLEQLLPYSGDLEEAMDNLKGSSADLMGSVSAVIKEDLLSVKDQLDIFVRNAAHDVADLAPLADSLHRIADTLAMLGLGDLRRVIQEQAEHIGQFVEGGEIPDDKPLMDMASALLYVEASLENLDRTAGGHDEAEGRDLSVNDEESLVLMPAGEQTQLVNLVINESRELLAEVKEGFNTFAVESGSFAAIEDAPAKLAQIEGALSMMNLPRAAALMGSAIKYVHNDILAQQQVPDPFTLDSLADVITSIEYYLEAIEQGRKDPESILAVAESSVEELGYAVSPPTSADDDVESVAEEIPEVAEDELTLSGDEPAFEAAPETEHDEPEEMAAPEDSPAAEPEPAPEIVGVATLGDGEDEFDADIEAEVDEEILEIFLEEADEVIESMADFLQAWRADPDDHKSLEALRRSYHTLKGSGRLAGAVVTGDYAWSFESLLNRVMEGKIEPGPILLKLLELSEPTLLGLVAHLKGEADRRPPVKRLMAVADSLADGNDVSMADLPMAASAGADKEPGDAATESPADIETGLGLDESPALDAGELAQEPFLEVESFDVELESMDSDIERTELSFATETPIPDDALLADDDLTDAAEVPAVEGVSAADEAFFAAETSLSDEALLTGEEPLLDESSLEISALPDVEEAFAAEGSEAEATAEVLDDAFSIEGIEALADEPSAIEEILEPEPAFDPVLAEVFRKETETHLAALRQFCEDHSAVGPFPITEDLHRALHTLHGSARMAGVPSIAVLSEPMDRYVRTLLERDIPFDHAGLATLEEFIGKLADALLVFDQPSPPQEDYSELSSRIITMHEQALAIPEPEAEPEPAAESIEAATPPSDELPEEDQALLEIFLEEAVEILATCEELLQRWPENLQDADLLHELQRALHTLKGSARLANVQAIGDLTHEMESLFEGITEGRRDADADLPPLILRCIDWLQQAVSQAGAGEALEPAGDCLAALAAWPTVDENTVDEPSGETPMIELDSTFAEVDAEDVQAESTAETETQEFVALEDVAGGPVDEPSEIESIGFAEDEDVELAPMSMDLTPAETLVPEAAGADYDTELLEIFLEEAEEIQDVVDRVLDQWSSEVENLAFVAELQRALHTLKGGARMANVAAVGDLAHEMESLLERIVDGHIAPEARFPALLNECHDWLRGGLEQARQLNSVAPATQLLRQLEAAVRGDVLPVVPESDSATEEAALESDEAASAEPTSTGEDAAVSLAEEELEDIAAVVTQPAVAEDADQSASVAAAEQVRVRADLLNDLVNYSGEINIYSARIGQQLTAWHYNLAELDQTVSRLREQLRKFEIETETQIMYRHDTGGDRHAEDFDPLEMDRFSTMQQLSRGMVESLGDLTSIQSLLDDLSGDTDTLLLQQQRVTSELQEGLMHTRMVAFSSILPRLRRIVRQTATETDKQVTLDISGAEGEVDRTQLNRLLPALEHILRNAVDHGIEAAAEREAVGKPATGTVRVTLVHQGSEVVLTVDDDGCGLDIDALREKAVEKGRLLPDADLSDRELMAFILESGFSTAKEVTQISGRGVGMDVANTEIKQLGGTLHMDTTRGQGTRFEIRLPLTVLVNQALMVQVAEATYAIQLPNVEHVIRVSRGELEPMVAGTESHFEYAGNRYQYLSLSKTLNGIAPVLPEEKQRIPLLLLRSGDHRVALQVDALLGRQEIVIKSVGPQLSTVSVLSGATILPDGEVALILDVGNLVRSVLAQQRAGDVEPLLPTASLEEQVEARRQTVMVVDDSITVRKVTERLLARYEYDVITAKDGIDALTVMQEQIPDIMLLDVEMPRMDGYELATAMRNDDEMKRIPIIMITSRTGDKHRQRALDIGVNEYMGKPYQEQDLIENIRALVGEPA